MGLVFARIWGDEHPRLTPAPGELLFTCLHLERIYTYTMCHHNWAYYTERREPLFPLSSISLWYLSHLSLLLCAWVYLCPFRMWQQSKPMYTSLCLCVYSSLIILMGMKDISIFAQLSPRSFASGLEAVPGGLPESAQVHCPWWSWATCLGAGPGLWYLEVCNSQVLCPWSGAVPGSYFGGKWITSPSQLVPLRKLVYLLLLLL